MICSHRKSKTPSRPYCTQEGVWICRTPTNMPEVGLVLSLPRSIIAVPEQSVTVPRGYQGCNDGG